MIVAASRRYQSMLIPSRGCYSSGKACAWLLIIFQVLPHYLSKRIETL